MTGKAPRNYTGLVVFGDSYSDNGHPRIPQFEPSLSVPPSNGGRYCDGLVWNEFLTQSLSIEYNVTLFNYAYNGAHINNGLTNNMPPKIVPDTATQIQAYLKDLDAYQQAASPEEMALSRILHVIWIGINPLLAIWRSLPTKERWIKARDQVIHEISLKVEEQVSELGHQITELISSDNTQELRAEFVVLTAPPLKTTLLVQQEARQWGGSDNTLIVEYVNLMSQMIEHYNTKLLELLTPIVKVRENGLAVFDLMKFWNDLQSSPNLYGITSLAACFPDVDKPPCPQPDHFQYWDILHPSSFLHAHLAQELEIFLRRFDD